MRRILSTLAFAAVIAGALAASSFAVASWTDAEANRRLAEVTDDTTRGTAGYMFEATFDRHLGDDIGPLCDWVDGHVQGARNEQEAIAALHPKVPGGDGMPVVLLAICGYNGDGNQQRQNRQAQYERIAALPNVSDAKLHEMEDSLLRDNGPNDTIWFYKAPYLWGEPRPAPTTWPAYP